MALSITAVANGSTDSPGYDLTLSGLTGYDHYTVTRQMGSGIYPDVNVRGMDFVSVTANTAAGSDYECPRDVVPTYLLTGYITTPPSSATASVTPTAVLPSDPSEAWMKCVEQPALSQKVSVGNFSVETRSSRVLGTYDVLGRSNPVIVSDVTSGRKGTITLNCVTFGSTYLYGSPAELELLLDSGETFLFQTPAYAIAATQDIFFRVTGDITRTRLNPIYMNSLGSITDLDFTYTIPFTEVDRPSTTNVSLGLRNYQSVLSQNATYSVVNAVYGTYLDLLQRNN